MIHKIFCVRDQQAAAYLPPFFLPTNGMATRVFADCINDPSHQFGAHPEDFSLWLIGQYDDVTGTVDPITPSTCLGKGVDYVRTKEESEPYRQHLSDTAGLNLRKSSDRETPPANLQNPNGAES